MSETDSRLIGAYGEQFKYISQHKGNLYVCINADSFYTGYQSSWDAKICNVSLRLYRYDLTLLDETREFITDGLVECGPATTIKATENYVILATGSARYDAINTNYVFRPLIQVVSLIDHSVKKFDLLESQPLYSKDKDKNKWPTGFDNFDGIIDII